MTQEQEKQEIPPQVLKRLEKVGKIMQEGHNVLSQEDFGWLNFSIAHQALNVLVAMHGHRIIGELLEAVEVSRNSKTYKKDEAKIEIVKEMPNVG